MQLNTLPTVSFVGGETQDFEFSTYSYSGVDPFSLADCTANFSIVHQLNRTGSAVLSKSMSVVYNAETKTDSLLTVRLLPSETVNLSGKYLYQITISDSSGTVEIPKQGVLLIVNNINKSLIT